MGNRAVLTFAPFDPANVGVYVHWNGGADSVDGFLKACRELGYRTPGNDAAYAMARLIGAVTLFFEGALSVGVDICERLDCDNGDNGTYLIGPDWEVTGRLYHDGAEPFRSDTVTDHVAKIIKFRANVELPESF